MNEDDFILHLKRRISKDLFEELKRVILLFNADPAAPPDGDEEILLMIMMVMLLMVYAGTPETNALIVRAYTITRDADRLDTFFQTFMRSSAADQN